MHRNDCEFDSLLFAREALPSPARSRRSERGIDHFDRSALNELNDSAEIVATFAVHLAQNCECEFVARGGELGLNCPNLRNRRRLNWPPPNEPTTSLLLLPPPFTSIMLPIREDFVTEEQLEVARNRAVHQSSSRRRQTASYFPLRQNCPRIMGLVRSD